MDRYAEPRGGTPDDLNIPLVVTARVEESADCSSVHFARPWSLDFQPGDWLDIRFLEPELAIGRTFSFSSAPSEPEIRVTYKRGVTPFKRRLDQTEPGDTLFITQFGSNGFRMKPRSPAVFIAGGVGIAPFRSMIRESLEVGSSTEITLIHVTKRDDAPFSEELAELAAGTSTLKVHHVVTSRSGRLTEARLRQMLPDAPSARRMFYVAGPPEMVSSAERLLARIGVDHEQILTDSFTGY